jgi:hypothetical protein
MSFDDVRYCIYIPTHLCAIDENRKKKKEFMFKVIIKEKEERSPLMLIFLSLSLQFVNVCIHTKISKRESILMNH